MADTAMTPPPTHKPIMNVCTEAGLSLSERNVNHTCAVISCTCVVFLCLFFFFVVVVVLIIEIA